MLFVYFLPYPLQSPLPTQYSISQYYVGKVPISPSVNTPLMHRQNGVLTL